MKLNKLTDRQVKTLKGPFKVGDGGGLWLKSRRPGDASWLFAYVVAGRPRELGLGPLHSVSLAEARERARQARQQLLAGVDPIEDARRVKQAQQLEQLRTITFAEACERFLATDRVENFSNAVHRKQWRSTLAKAYPELGSLPLQSINSAILLKVLLPIMKATPETGSRLRGRIERVLEWARPLGLFTGPNPAAREALKDHLPAKRKVEHHKALDYREVPQLMAALRARDYVSARCLEFTILTAARTGESIAAKWSEIELESGLWVVPASRMKSGREHRVPLSRRALEIVRSLPRVSEFIFANAGGRALSNQAMSELLKSLRPGYTVHGTARSSFMDWAHEKTGYAKHVIDMALAHTIGDKVEAAYRRGDLFAKRVRLMSEWSRYCEQPAAVGANVVGLRA